MQSRDKLSKLKTTKKPTQTQIIVVRIKLGPVHLLLAELEI
jgi:hypothetical protein